MAQLLGCSLSNFATKKLPACRLLHELFAATNFRTSGTERKVIAVGVTEQHARMFRIILQFTTQLGDIVTD